MWFGGCGNGNIFAKGTRHKTARRANHHGGASPSRVPDAVQRSSRCSAEPGPILSALVKPAGRALVEGETHVGEWRITPSAQSALQAAAMAVQITPAAFSFSISSAP